MHSIGSASKEALEAARSSVAGFIGAKPENILFVSCGSEANNLAVKGIANANKSKGKHIVVSSIEHFSVLNSVKRLSQEGLRLHIFP